MVSKRKQLEEMIAETNDTVEQTQLTKSLNDELQRQDGIIRKAADAVDSMIHEVIGLIGNHSAENKGHDKIEVRKPRERKPRNHLAKAYSQAIIHITFKCNMRCPRCTQKVHRSKYGNYMITREQYLKILSLIGNRVKTLTLSGGEPTLWVDLKWAIQKAHESGIQQVLVISNGLRRKASDYGDADKVYVTNYGAINRIDLLRLRKELGSRFCITNTCQFEWKLSSQSNTLPAICNCAHLFFAGDKVWPCQGAVYEKPGLLVEDYSTSLFESQDPYMQDICGNCISNLKVCKPDHPGLVGEISLWNSRYMWILGSNSKSTFARGVLRKIRQLN